MAKPLWIGLFRGINVGGNNKLPMKELAQLLTAEGLENVRTYIASGNILFRSELGIETLDKKIGDAIEGRFGFRPSLFLVTLEHLEKLLNTNPYRDWEAKGKGQHIFFIKGPIKLADLEGLAALKDNGEDFTLTDEAFFLYAPEGVGRSKLVEKMGKYLKADMTARNLNTVETLRDMAKEG